MSQLYSVCQQIRIFKGATVHAQWQNYFSNKTVDGYEFQPFSVSTVQVNRSADEGGITVEGPAAFRFISKFQTAVNDQHIVEVRLLDSTSSVTDPSFAGFRQIAMFTGVALTMTNNLTQVRLSVGAAINAISGDVPGRKMTSSLVGVLPTL